MIITIDTETQGLNTHNWIMGCVIKQNGVTKTFLKQKEMWNYIQEIADYCKKNRKTLLIYAHNMMYDWHVLTHGIETKECYQYSSDPFILDQKTEEGQIYAKWLSTTSLWRGSLEEIGKALGNNKTTTPEWLKKEEYKPNKKEIEEAMKYMIQDTKIVMQYLEELQKLLSAEKMKPRWILTASQIGIAYTMKELNNSKEGRKLLLQENWEPRFPRIHDPEQIHEGLRGGRVDALQLGHYENCSTIDINSHYTHAIQNIEIPITQKETYIEEPLQNDWNAETLFSYCGLSGCIIEVKKGAYGVLPIRIDETESFHPNKNKQILVGVWTHIELAKAVKNGYKVHYIYFSRIYQTLKNNPFKEIFQKIYEKKRDSKTQIEKHFYKMLLNGPIGKFAQRRENYIQQWNYIENEWKYIRDGYVPIEISGSKRLYRKSIGINYPSYYNPLINMMVTAYARIKLLEHMEKIPSNKLYYIDTDSITADTQAIQEAQFTYGIEQGMFKIEHANEPVLIYGKKSYCIGDDIRLSGVGKAWITKEKFMQGQIEYKRMQTKDTTSEEEQIGTFTTIERNLQETKEKTIQTIKKVNEQDIIVDIKTDVTKYIQYIPKWVLSKEFTH